MVVTHKMVLPLSGLPVRGLCPPESGVVRPARYPRNLALLSLAVNVGITAGIPLLFYLFVVLTFLPALVLYSLTGLV
jgi:hypothetical protein